MILASVNRFDSQGADVERGTAAPADARQTPDKKLPSASAAESQVDRVALAVDLLLTAGGEPVCDLLGNLLIRRREKTGGRGNCQEYPLRSELTLGWISKLIYEAEVPALRGWEQTQVISILVGFAIENQEQPEAADILERDPVLAMLNTLLTPNSEVRGTATEHLQGLRNYARKQGICTAQMEQWPKSAAQLTLHLRRMRPWLEELGIHYTYQRKDRQRLHIFWRADAVTTAVPAIPVASVTASGASATAAVSSVAHDDTDDEITEIDTIAEKPPATNGQSQNGHSAQGAVQETVQGQSVKGSAGQQVKQPQAASSGRVSGHAAAAVEKVAKRTDDTAAMPTASAVSSAATPAATAGSKTPDDTDDGIARSSRRHFKSKP